MLTGSPTPRLATPPLRDLREPGASRGPEVLRLARLCGETLMPWQREAALRMLERKPDGSLRFRTVVIIVSRRSGKSRLLQAIALWRMIFHPGDRVLGTGQRLELARECCRGSYDIAAASPHMAESLGPFRGNNNAYGFTLEASPGSGVVSRYSVMPQTEKAGRGAGAGLVILDEACELRGPAGEQTLAALAPVPLAVPDGQIVLISSQGDSRSAVLNRLRDLGLSGRDPSVLTLEWSAPDDAAIEDDAALRWACPALGHTLDLAAIHALRGSLSASAYRREILGQRVSGSESAVDSAAWAAAADPGARFDRDRPVFCGVDVSPDKRSIALAVAQPAHASGEAPILLGIAKVWPDITTAHAELLGELEALKPQQVAWYGGTSAESLRSALVATGFPLLEIGKAKQPVATQRFVGDLAAQALRHVADPALDYSVGTSTRDHPADGAWRFLRSSGEAAPLCAAVAALYAARQAPGPLDMRIITLAEGS